uniref:hypothetical protein n=1 Tax=Photorhabdus sp. RM322S TaxID=3342825 RepID=UPI0036DB2ACD
MNKLYRVAVSEQEFNIIKNNKNRCIGVADTGEEGVNKNFLERVSSFFIFKYIGIENLFDDQCLPTDVCKGDFILLSMVKETGCVDISCQRMTIKIDEVHQFRNNEINIYLYEYSFLEPSYFFQ